MPETGTRKSRRTFLRSRARGRASTLRVAEMAFAVSLLGCGATPSAATTRAQQGGHGQADTTAVAPFECNANALPPEPTLRRLTKQQLVNTVTDMVELVLPPQLASAATKRLQPAFSSLTGDTVSKFALFSSMDQAISDEHVGAHLNLAQELATQLTLNDQHVQALLKCETRSADGSLLASGPARVDCIDAFIRRFGRRAFRHALSEQEFEFLRSSYELEAGGKNARVSLPALHSLLVLIFNMPQFLYHSDWVSQPVAPNSDVYFLHPYALAARLSYQYWQTMPDEELLVAAERGELNEQAGLAHVVDRVLADPRSERGLRTFITEWFSLSTLRPLDSLVGDPVFDAFAGDDLPSPDLREAMVSEVIDSFTFHIKRGGSYAQWLSSPYSFARSDELAGLYDVAPWDGSSEPPRFEPGTRAGLLTRAALLATGLHVTRPIMKGVFIRRSLLCDDLPPPPCNMNNVPVLSPDSTTRQLVEALTEQPGTSCASCHAYQINPLGFATENYDSLGRLRREQRLFAASGAEVARKPVNTHAIPRISLFDATPIAGASDLTSKILQSGKGESCFARQYLRFAYGRAEDTKGDGCLLESIRAALEKPDGLREALRATALTQEYRQRLVKVDSSK